MQYSLAQNMTSYGEGRLGISDVTCGLCYKSFVIVNYDLNDSGQYYKLRSQLRLAKASLSLDRKL
jgi:hypothetical protein